MEVAAIAGHFLRRSPALDVIALMDAVDEIRAKLWKQQQPEFLRGAIIDADGTISPTEGDKKLGMTSLFRGLKCGEPRKTATTGH
jgi:hypothetical protein